MRWRRSVYFVIIHIFKRNNKKIIKIKNICIRERNKKKRRSKEYHKIHHIAYINIIIIISNRVRLYVRHPAKHWHHQTAAAPSTNVPQSTHHMVGFFLISNAVSEVTTNHRKDGGARCSRENSSKMLLKHEHLHLREFLSTIIFTSCPFCSVLVCFVLKLYQWKKLDMRTR